MRIAEINRASDAVRWLRSTAWGKFSKLVELQVVILVLMEAGPRVHLPRNTLISRNLRPNRLVRLLASQALQCYVNLKNPCVPVI